jgi:prolyl-tRNA synthetase
VREAAEKLYAELQAAGMDVLLEDRDERPGVLFADMDLLGIPHRLVLSERGLAAGTIEYKARTAAAPENVPLESALQILKDKFQHA